MKNDNDKKFREPGFWESIREIFLGTRRRFACLQVEVTSSCNARCIYCPHTTFRDRWQSRDMSMEIFDRLWPAMRVAFRVHLQGWGEPLINPHFFDMAALARKAGCAVSTTTCGLIMDDNLARKIVDSGIDIIAFSLAGTDADTNAVRQGANFNRVCRSISTLQQIRRARGGVHLEVHLAYLMLASAMGAVRGLPALAKNLGVHEVVISTLDYIPAPGFEQEAFGIGEKDKLSEAATILNETEAEDKKLDVGIHWSLPRADAAGIECREKIADSFFVSSDGAVSPCVFLNLPIGTDYPSRHVFGNVKEQDVLEIRDSEKFRIFRERLASGDPAGPCRSCPKRFIT
jgi:radical SAM protein with 4Fe4S-binding SPASM domain